MMQDGKYEDAQCSPLIERQLTQHRGMGGKENDSHHFTGISQREKQQYDQKDGAYNEVYLFHLYKNTYYFGNNGLLETFR
jgi:hypothetical protein